MRSCLLALVLLLLPASARAGVKETIATLAPSATVFVVDSKGDELIAQNADTPFVPASVTKIVTAWLALEVLGGNYASRLASISTTNACSTCAEAAIHS